MWLRLLAVGLLLAGGCTPAPARDPAIVQEALEYVGKIEEWEPVEAAALRAIHDVERSQYVDDDCVVATLGSVMADVELHLEEIGPRGATSTTPSSPLSNRPRTAAVTELHDRYRTQAMEQRDYLALSRGTESMKRSRSELAPQIFASIARDPAPGTLYYEISVRAARGERGHFVPPDRCAEVIASRRREGIAAAQHPPELGADDAIRAVLLSREAERRRARFQRGVCLPSRETSIAARRARPRRALAAISPARVFLT